MIASHLADAWPAIGHFFTALTAAGLTGLLAALRWRCWPAATPPCAASPSEVPANLTTSRTIDHAEPDLASSVISAVAGRAWLPARLHGEWQHHGCAGRSAPAVSAARRGEPAWRAACSARGGEHWQAGRGGLGQSGGRGGLDAAGRQPGQHAGMSPARSTARTSPSWAWRATVPLRSTDRRIPTAPTRTTPVVVNGVVDVQDLESNVMAISLATGKVLWRHAYNLARRAARTGYAGGRPSRVRGDESRRGPPCRRPPARSCGAGRTGNDHEGIAMAPGYDHDTRTRPPCRPT